MKVSGCVLAGVLFVVSAVSARSPLFDGGWRRDLAVYEADGHDAPALLGSAAGQPQAARTSKRVTTKHLGIQARASEDTVAPGARVSLLLDITPRRGIHVYAPGATDYRVIELAMTPTPGVTFHPAKFPPSEIYEFVPLNERIPVYQKPFQLEQPVTVGDPSKSSAGPRTVRSLTIEGMLNYQACDDRICFAPASVPVSWTVEVE